MSCTFESMYSCILVFLYLPGIYFSFLKVWKSQVVTNDYLIWSLSCMFNRCHPSVIILLAGAWSGKTYDMFRTLIFHDCQSRSGCVFYAVKKTSDRLEYNSVIILEKLTVNCSVF